jgi:hypothetical protein
MRGRLGRLRKRRLEHLRNGEMRGEGHWRGLLTRKTASHNLCQTTGAAKMSYRWLGQPKG